MRAMNLLAVFVAGFLTFYAVAIAVCAYNAKQLDEQTVSDIR